MPIAESETGTAKRLLRRAAPGREKNSVNLKIFLINNRGSLSPIPPKGKASAKRKLPVPENLSGELSGTKHPPPVGAIPVYTADEQ